MPRPDPRRPRENQAALFEAPPTNKDSARADQGRHTQAFRSAIHAAHEAGHLEEIDGALASSLIAAAWSLDQFEAQNKPYGSTKLLTPIVEALREARMTPDSRQTETEDHIAELVADLSRAEANESEWSSK